MRNTLGHGGYDGYGEHRPGVRELLGNCTPHNRCHDHHHDHSNKLHEHRISYVNSFSVGDPIHYDILTNTWELATEGNCDFIVVGVDSHGYWFEPASTGIYNINKIDIHGSVYLNSISVLTNTPTTQKIGFIDDGVIFLNITGSSSSPIIPTIGDSLDFSDSSNSGYITLLMGSY